MRGLVVASVVGAAAVVLNLLSFGLMQSLVARCPVCRHRALRHRMRRDRLAASQAADTVQMPSVDRPG